MRMSELLNEVRRFELDEGFSPREIKMAIGIASDPRYAKGNMTGAVNAIEKMKKGLSKHPQVMAVLKRQNEDVDLDEAKMTTDITNDKKIFKDIEKMGVKVKNITPLSGNEKNSATITMVGTKNNINKVVDKYQMKHMMGVQDFDEDIDEAVSMAQQAAIAISKKEKGEKPKKEKDEGNEFGMALKSARDKGEKTFVVSGKKYNVTEEGEASRIVEPYRPEFGLDEAPKMTYALVGTDMKIYAIDSDEKDLKLNRSSLEKRLKDVSPLKIARLKTAQSIGDKVDKSQLKEEVELDEAKILDNMSQLPKGIEKPLKSMQSVKKDADLGGMKITHIVKNKQGNKVVAAVVSNGKTNFIYVNNNGVTPLKEEVDLDEKYDLYHKDFSSAMQHAYDYAKKKMGITVDPKEIDSKVATGPKKPTEGKTNKYMLKGKGGNLQIQVYNKGGSKPFELNMYKEENDLISQASRHISHMQMSERKVDPADVDDDASQKDVEDAGKNIIMQLRKSVSMRGNKDVEFSSGKQKVDMKIAQKALDMYNKMKPQEKTKFQNTIAKSYKDLLNTIKGN